MSRDWFLVFISALGNQLHLLWDCSNAYMVSSHAHPGGPGQQKLPSQYQCVALNVKQWKWNKITRYPRLEGTFYKSVNFEINTCKLVFVDYWPSPSVLIPMLRSANVNTRGHPKSKLSNHISDQGEACLGIHTGHAVGGGPESVVPKETSRLGTCTLLLERTPANPPTTLLPLRYSQSILASTQNGAPSSHSYYWMREMLSFMTHTLLQSMCNEI